MQDTPDDWRPTETSTALVVVASVLGAGALAAVADVVEPAVVGALAAVTAAALVWAAGWEGYRTAGNFLASVLVLPVGLGITATTIGTVLVLAESLFPVPVAAQIPTTVVRLVARAMVVVGASMAVFGATTSIRGVLDGRTVGRAATTAVRTTVVPFLLGAMLATRAALVYLGSTAAGPGPGAGQLLGGIVRGLSGVVFRPEVSGPHLSTFFLLGGAALLAVQRGLRALPLRELIPDGEVHRERRRAIERGERWLLWCGAAVLATFPVATVVELAVSQPELRAALGPALYDALAGVTTSPGLRALAWWATVVGLAVAGTVWLLRRFARSSADRIGSTVAPLAGGVLVTLGSLLAANGVLTWGIGWVAEKLPGRFGTEFASTAASVVDVYGAGTVVLCAVATMVVLAAGAVSVLWLVVATEYVAERTAGATVASLALFNAAAFAAVVGTDTGVGALDGTSLVVLGALVAAVLVWDAGEFGATMGRELGRHARTRRAELVHATGTLAVGGVGAGVTFLIADRSVGVLGSADSSAAVALVAVVAGLVLVVAALR